MAKAKKRGRKKLTSAQQRCVGRKISIITREERAKPKAKRRSRGAIVGKAVGICKV